MFKVMAPYQPAPPPSSPFDWGDEGRVHELLGESFELELEEHVSTLHVSSGEEYWELFSTSYGPTKTLADSLGDERREELHRDWVDFFETNYRANGGIVHTARVPARARERAASASLRHGQRHARDLPSDLAARVPARVHVHVGAACLERGDDGGS